MSQHAFADVLIGIPWFAWIAIVAIVSSSVAQVIARRFRHVERMEMIRHGMNPEGGKLTTPEKSEIAEL